MEGWSQEDDGDLPVPPRFPDQWFLKFLKFFKSDVKKLQKLKKTNRVFVVLCGSRKIAALG